MRWLVLVLLLASCETTRDNTLTVKARTRNAALTNCYVADRCDITP